LLHLSFEDLSKCALTDNSEDINFSHEEIGGCGINTAFSFEGMFLGFSCVLSLFFGVVGYCFV
jgi:hypothetical protein